MNRWSPPTYRKSFSPSLGQTFDEMLGLPAESGDILRLVYHTGGTWLGFYVALQPKNPTFVKAVGWVLALGMGLAGVLDVVSLGKRIAGTHP